MVWTVKDSVADLFDRVAARYDESVPFFATLGCQLVAWSGPLLGGSVLDVGAGRGAVSVAVLEQLSDRGGSVTAIDVSPAMVEQLEALRLDHLRAVVMDVEHLDLPADGFDHVFGGFVFHILTDVDQALREVGRVLRPGGSASFSVPGPNVPDDGWHLRYGDIYERLRVRIDGEAPAGMSDVGRVWDTCAEVAGLILECEEDLVTEIEVGGPASYWDWLMSHGNRWLYDALPEHDAEEFHQAVLASFETHPTGGRSIIAGPRFIKVRKPG